ncbi:glycine--tRNA ligase subunit beta [Desulfonatronovibrio magnus]|uniref:glycine--tRNA ligase subunit beta n=1 Tax=Desulfonatronovibrio magnus TaxID=698827 RepID=UPI0005EB822C|nr:glycine--tRNA ligase subunit beta [Desulfonatronovibrio magnus]RQD65580.1 MAG: glycine--tRNA ligase subunit beta [Desulfonatronovibrio sp. MSAO_Bac4]
MPEFVMEIGFEEMPARFLQPLTTELNQIFQNALSKKMISYESTRAYSTPRRLCIYVSAMAEHQDSKQELVTGPPCAIAFDENNNLTKAGQGFARSQNIDAESLFRHKTDKGEYLAVNKTIGGQKTASVLPVICVEAVQSLNFPKKMRWSDAFTFGRPVRWILALLDDKVISFQISDVKSGASTYGHRVLGPGPWQVSSAADYFSIISKQAGVILDVEQRMNIIRNRSKELADEVSGNIVENDNLIRETANLSEYPNPVLGKFADKYLELPREVLLTSMQAHQKSFGLEDANSKLLPYFLTVINNQPQDVDLVRKGWERVLKARLEDAMFFWNADRSVTIQDRQNKLDRVVFLAPLGSMGDKVRRMEKIADYLCQELGIDSKDNISKAALICKSDLVSEMVGEFADLQGIMGGIYARLEGYPQEVSRAIYEHYLPTGPESKVPETLAGAIISMADKSDTLLGCFGLNMIPTGAADPYALRRQSLGLIRIILEYRLDLNLQRLFDFCCKTYQGIEWKQDLQKAQDDLLRFVAVRLKAFWQGRGVNGKFVDAVLQAGTDNILTAEKRLDALIRFSKHAGFEPAVLTFKRIDNIIRKQGVDTGFDLADKFKSELVQDKFESALADEIMQIQAGWDELWEQKDFDALFDQLHQLRPVVDDFFDNVMVMAEDKDLRENRLNMLNILAIRLSRLADFSALQV